MFKNLLFVFTLALPLFSWAQLDPVSWTFSLGNEDEVHAVLAEAEIEPGWYIYSQFLDDGGPIPTAIKIDDEQVLKFYGKPTENGNVHRGYDELFQMEVTKFSKKASFSRSFSINPKANEITGVLTFMACDSKKCLPPKEVEFRLPTER